MRVKRLNPLFLIITAIMLSPDANGQSLRPVHTYSIVARDSVTGEMGVAVQSHWFSVGTVVTWGEAGVGVVATQSFAELSYGPLGLELMKAGKTAPEALKALLAADKSRDVRQVAMVDRFGNVAVHTGKNCIREAGHFKGAMFSTQANLMERATVWDAMAQAYSNADGDLLNRLMAALQAAQDEGGDIRGMQSAAILIVPGKTEGAPWREKLVDLRVDDHSQPLEEMKRLIRIHRAYGHMNKGDEYLADKNFAGAMEEYGIASELYPENIEILYWFAVGLTSAGKVEESLPYFKKVFKQDRKWVELTKRIPENGLLPDDKKILKKILQQANNR